MELTQEEIQWVKDMVEVDRNAKIIAQRDRIIKEERRKVEKKFKKQLEELALNGKIEERKALIEIMVAEADDAEQIVLQQHS